jgi:hypothetical protein
MKTMMIIYCKGFQQGVEGLFNWDEVMIADGISSVIELIKMYYLDAYECYLLRRLSDQDEVALNKQKCREQLQVYYKFIACFDIDPYIKDHLDFEILYELDDERYDFNNGNRTIEDTYGPMYSKIKTCLTQRDISNTKKDVIDIIKRNTKRNIDELNKKVVELFQMDETFKNTMLKLRQPHLSEMR